MRKAGKIIFFIGLVLSILLAIGGTWAVVSGASDISRIAGTTATGDSSGLRLELKAGDKQTILVEGSAKTTCTVRAPSGDEVPTSQPVLNESVNTNDGTFTAASDFTAPTDGTYHITCDPATNITAVDAGTITTAVLKLGGGVLTLMGIFLTGAGMILGLILWLVGRNREQQTVINPQFPQGPQHPGPYQQ